MSRPCHCRSNRRSVSITGPLACGRATPGLSGAMIGFLDHVLLFASWPGLTRPSTSYFLPGIEDVDARHKAGHDGVSSRSSHMSWQPSSDPVLGDPKTCD